MASDQGLSIFDEPESADDKAAPGGSTARGNIWTQRPMTWSCWT